MTENLTHIAVLTGDIVGSTQMPPEDLERAFDALSISAEVQADWHGEDLHFTRQRGDGWQVRLARPELALRSALAFRAALRCEGKEFSTLIAVSEGVAGPVSSGSDLNSQSSSVYVESGRLLDWIKEINPAYQIDKSPHERADSAYPLADHISQKWTPTQAITLLPALAPGHILLHSQIARSLGKSRQAVSKALDAAGLDAILYALQLIEEPEAKHD